MTHKDDINDKIISAIEELLSKKSVDDLTVTDIIKQANISRTTFYRHFQDKYDAMNWKFIEEFMSLQKDSSSIGELPKQMLNMILYAEQNRTVFKKLLLYNGQNSLFDTLYKLMCEKWTRLIKTKLNIEELPYEIVFAVKMYCYGGVRMMFERIVVGMPIDIDTYYKFLTDNMPLTLKNIIDQ